MDAKTMTRNCERCGELLEVDSHQNANDLNKQTLEIQKCISCGWATTVKL